MNAALSPPPPIPAVAIIGIGCLFPKSPDLKSYWRLLLHGTDAITEVPSSHWSPEDFFDEDPKKPDHVYCKRGGFLSPVPFDPSRFGIPPATLEATDTSQLLGLLAARAALEDAGYGEQVAFDRDRTAVILGVTGTQELVIPLGARLGHPIWRKALNNASIGSDEAERIISDIASQYVSWQESSFPGLLGNVVAGRISNRLNLGGTNCVVDAACASSMSAVNHAILELETRRADMVITGGVDTLNDIFMHMCFSKSQILSPTGDVRPFSKDADGTLLGEGVGLLVMKRLEDAEKAGDRIYAVIRGLGSSSDGRSQSIYAPNPDGQASALKRAYARAGVDPATVGMVEAHGTGTRVGDEVEFRALSQVFAGSKPPGERMKCAIGSVKSMIGHTKAAAGSAGLIKAALALHHKSLPPTLKAGEPDPKLKVEESPFYIASRIRPWFSPSEAPRRSGVSAFGFGGSNYHAVLEEYQPMKKETAWDGSVEILAFSGSDNGEIESQIESWVERFEENLPWEALPGEAAKTRSRFETSAEKRALVVLDLSSQDRAAAVRTLKDALETLESQTGKPFWKTSTAVFGSGGVSGKLAFVFPGQGSQYVEMGRDLMMVFPEAFESMERMNRACGKERPLSDCIYPLPTEDPKEKKIQEETLRSTDLAQPAIGAVSVALMRVLERFNVLPGATCGHSYGELPALLAAGRIDSDALCRLSVARGRLMAEAGKAGEGDPGTMLAVKAPLPALRNLVAELSSDVVLANLNSPDQGVLSGSTAAIDAAEKACKAKKMKAVRLPVAAAFHSRLVAAARGPFEGFLEKERFLDGRVPVMSNTTGKPYPEDNVQAKNILGSQIVNSVDFVANVENLYEMGVRTFIEVGPKTVLTGLVKAILGDREFHALGVDASGGKKFGLIDLAMALCHLAALGYPVDLSRWDPPKSGSDPVKPKMSIPIHGANYRSPAPGVSFKNEAVQSTRESVEKAPAARATERRRTPPPVVAEISPDPVGTRMAQGDPMPTEGHYYSMESPGGHPFRNPGVGAPEFLRVVEEGLKSIQALQTQTAEAHKKFLDTQTEASRTLQMMMDSTGRLAESLCGMTPAFIPKADISGVGARAAAPPIVPPQMDVPRQPQAVSPGEKAPSLVRQPVFAQISPVCAPVSAWLPEEEPVATSKETVTPSPAPVSVSAGQDPDGLSRVLLEVVSQLTGYPESMLDLHMDLEADLGIDSIKRVEILSTLEERLPDLPQILPEKLGTLKTLGQILSELSPAEGKRPQPAAKTVAVDCNFPPEPVTEPVSGLEAHSEITPVLLEVVSQLTGYPESMLELQMDLEADLGIDSIKRVEILSTLEERMPHLPQVTPETMSSLKTLGQIVDYLSTNEPAAANFSGPSASAQTELAKPQANTTENPFASHESPDFMAAPAPLRVVTVVSEETDPTRKSLAGRSINGPVLICRDAAGLCRHLEATFAEKGIETRILEKENFSSPEPFSGIGALMLLSPIDPEMAFSIVKSAESAIKAKGDSGLRGFLASVTRMDGAFGFSGRAISDPNEGALAGLVKTAHREWNGVLCRAFDLSPETMNLPDAATRMVEELLSASPEGPVEVGFSEAGRNLLTTCTVPYKEYPDTEKLSGVWLVTGGGRGVTAECVKGLARHSDIFFVLLGRSPVPAPEPVWLAGIGDPKAMKAAILANGFPQARPAPAELEGAYRRFAAAREIADTLAALNRCGRGGVYLQADVLDPNALSSVMESVRKAYGPVTGMIHGAGVLRDRLIGEKSIDQFRRVFDTKVKGLRNLLTAAGTAPLTHLVLFSSVAARYGNAGQSDYAMANEVLNKTAWWLKSERPALRALSINWGPWDGGMVTPALKRVFEARGVKPIPISSGVAGFVRIVGGMTPSTPAEVIIGHGFEEKSPSQVADPALSLSFKQELNTERFPIFNSHAPCAAPSLPFAFMTEWVGLGALHANPGLSFHGIDDLRLFEDVPVTREGKTIRLMSGKARRVEGLFEVDVEIRNGVRSGLEFVHSKARALLGEKPASPPAFPGDPLLDTPSKPRPAEAVYGLPPLSGVALRGIRKVTGIDANGAAAQIDTAPPPEKWMREPLRNHWVADPLAIEAAFQLLRLWGFEQKGALYGIHRAESYRQYCSRYPSEGLRALLKIREASGNEIVADVTLLGPERTVVAELKGCVATVVDGR